MAELARMHGDKQIWLTRSHLAALATTTLFIAVLSFFVGLRVGQGRATAPAQVAPLLLPDPAKEDALEIILHEIEVAQAEGATASDFTFNDSLSNDSAPSAPTAALPSVERTSTAAPPTALSAPTPGAVPPLPVREGWSIQAFSFEDPREAEEKVALLNGAGWSAYQVTALVNGQNWHRVRVGGYPNKEDAAEASEELSAGLGLEDLMLARAP